MKKPIILITAIAVVVVAFIAGRTLRTPSNTNSTTTPSSQVNSNANTNSNTSNSNLASFTSMAMGFSLQYSKDFKPNDAYSYQLSPTQTIKGVQFMVPTSFTNDTNLSPDSYISVEQLPSAKPCTADKFLPDPVAATTASENGRTYSVAQNNGAAAGNRYDETVYAIPSTTNCLAVRYYIHSTVLENYPKGTVQAYDQAALTQSFDQIRDSLRITK